MLVFEVEAFGFLLPRTTHRHGLRPHVTLIVMAAMLASEEAADMAVHRRLVRPFLDLF